jgi:hypothetical protein
MTLTTGFNPNFDPAVFLSPVVRVVGRNRVAGAEAGYQAWLQAALLELFRNRPGAILGKRVVLGVGSRGIREPE